MINWMVLLIIKYKSIIITSISDAKRILPNIGFFLSIVIMKDLWYNIVGRKGARAPNPKRFW